MDGLLVGGRLPSVPVLLLELNRWQAADRQVARRVLFEVFRISLARPAEKPKGQLPGAS